MNDRFRFRIPITNKYGKFEKFVYFDLFNQPAITCRASDIFQNEEQCTGLKDENGTLIYEGDIVECFYDHFDGNFTEKKVTGVVRWGVGEWSVQNEKKGDWYFLSYANYEEKHLQSDSVKVIGNIHENPELLEDK